MKLNLMNALIIIFLSNLFSSNYALKRNLDWHRKIILISIPLFTLTLFAQAEYIIRRR